MSGARLEPREIARLKERSDAAGLARLGAHAALLAATGTAIAISAGGAWLVPALLCHGVVQVALFAPLHECTHRTAFRSRRLNDWGARVLGAIHVLPAGFFRHFHLAHHRFTQDPARDPELAGPKPQSRAAYLVHASGLPYWRDRVAELVRHACGRVDETFVAERGRAHVTREARIHLALYAGVAALSLGLGWSGPLLLWLLPALLGQPFLRLYLLAEHGLCPQDGGPLATTRSVATRAPLRLLMWNMPYHAEHHAYPNVPSQALPALHARLAGRLEVAAPGYAAFHREYLRAIG